MARNRRETPQLAPRLRAYGAYITSKGDVAWVEDNIERKYVLTERLPHHPTFLPDWAISRSLYDWDTDPAAWIQAYMAAALLLRGHGRVRKLYAVCDLMGVSFLPYHHTSAGGSGGGFVLRVDPTPEMVESWNMDHSGPVLLVAISSDNVIAEVAAWGEAGLLNNLHRRVGEFMPTSAASEHSLSTRRPSLPPSSALSSDSLSYCWACPSLPLHTGDPTLDRVGADGISVIARTQQRNADKRVLCAFLNNAVVFYPTYLHMERDMPGSFAFFLGADEVIPSDLMESLPDRRAFPTTPGRMAEPIIRAWFQRMWADHFSRMANACLVANGGAGLRTPGTTNGRVWGAALASLEAKYTLTSAPGFGYGDNPMGRIMSLTQDMWLEPM